MSAKAGRKQAQDLPDFKFGVSHGGGTTEEWPADRRPRTSAVWDHHDGLEQRVESLYARDDLFRSMRSVGALWSVIVAETKNCFLVTLIAALATACSATMPGTQMAV